MPTEPEPPPLAFAPSALALQRQDSPRDKAMSRQLALARQATHSSDLATAAAHYRVLVLLAPSDPTFRHQLQVTEEAIRAGVDEQLRIGRAAQRNGDPARAKEAMLHVLALDPANAEAAKALRDIEREAVARVQGDRVARIRLESLPPLTLTPRANAEAGTAASYDLDQRLEMLRAGDLQTGLRELRVFVEANPNDRAARNRIGAAVAERAHEAENQGKRESALALYEQAGTLRGESTPDWTARAKALRKAISEDLYAEGMRAWRTDLALAIRQLEASLRYDPQNLKAATRLREAKQAQEKLKRLSQ